MKDITEIRMQEIRRRTRKYRRRGERRVILCLTLCSLFLLAGMGILHESIQRTGISYAAGHTTNRSGEPVLAAKHATNGSDEAVLAAKHATNGSDEAVLAAKHATKRSGGPVLAAEGYGSVLLRSGVDRYVTVSIAAFAAGVLLTILCIRCRRRRTNRISDAEERKEST